MQEIYGVFLGFHLFHAGIRKCCSNCKRKSQHARCAGNELRSTNSENPIPHGSGHSHTWISFGFQSGALKNTTDLEIRLWNFPQLTSCLGCF